jgi:hypothetical protein
MTTGSFTEHFRNDENKQSATKASSAQEINQRVSCSRKHGANKRANISQSFEWFINPATTL